MPKHSCFSCKSVFLCTLGQKKIENALISIVMADFHWSHDESGVLDCVGFPPEQHLVIEPVLSFRGQIWVVPLPDWSHVFFRGEGGGGWGLVVKFQF